MHHLGWFAAAVAFVRQLKLARLLPTVLVVVCLTFPVLAQDGEGTVLSPTWLLESAGPISVDAPPDDAASAAEIDELMALMDGRDEDTLQQIAFWNAGPPSYRWNQIALEAMLQRGMPANTAFRGLALLHAAIHDATVAAWDEKYTYNRLRPSDMNAHLITVIPNPSSPSYPSDYAATAAAASAILGWVFPDEARAFADLAEQAAQSRLLAGVEYPSDLQAGWALGEQIAALAIERGNSDGSAAQWTGSVPTESGMWTGANPAFATMGTWRTWALTSPDQFRPAPPPAYDSEMELAEMEEVRSFERTPATNALAMFWEYGAGGRRIHWFWNDVTDRLVLETGLHDAPLAAARAYAAVNIAGYDSLVACWDAKFTYWAMRPFQLDPEFSPVFTTPNHPSYPSAHSCISTAVATVLADLFPVEADQVLGMAEQAGESRIWGGIHFRSDVIAGRELGAHVGKAVLDHITAFRL